MKQDLRKLTHEAIEVIRIQSVKMVVKSNFSNKEVCKIMEIDKTLLSKWMNMYRRWGWKALNSKKNPWWRPKDSKKNLLTKEKHKLKKLLLQEPRDIKQLQLELSLWTAKIVAKLIEKIFFKKLKEWQVRELLKELGFTNQKPIFRAYQQNLEKVAIWKNEIRPAIEKEAKEEDREIFYWDEAWFKSTEHRWRTWWIKWKTPIVSATGARFWINAMSIISKNSAMKFMVYEGTFTSDTLLVFLKKLVFKTNKKYTLVLDGHPTHKTKKVTEYLESIDHQVKIYFLPPYSPELNPDELVWNNVKEHMKGLISASKSEIRRHVLNGLSRIQKSKNLISSFFLHPEYL